MKFNNYKVKDLISEIAMGPFGSNIKVDCFVETGVPVLNGSNVDDVCLIEDSFNYVTEEKAKSLGRANASRGDIVVTHRGTLGQIAFIPFDSKYERYVISQSQFRFRCNYKAIPEYIAYYFHSPIGQHKLLSNASQVGVPALARATSTFQQIEIKIPEVEYQNKVVFFLENMRKKVKNNQLMIENLEEQLDSIYKYYFVDFVKFGEKMPHDWSKKSLKNNTLCSIIKPGVDRFDSKIYYATANVNNLLFKSSKTITFDNRETRANMQPRLYSVWFAKMKNSVKHLFLNSAMEEFINSSILSTGFCGLQCSEESFEYVASYIRNRRFEKEKDYRSHGTTQEAINQNDLDKFEFIVPSKVILEEYHELTSPIFNKINNLLIENIKLNELRDTLLPKLMSGEIDVTDLDI